MIEIFLYGAWVGGQALYWFLLRHQTEAHAIQCWDSLLLKLEVKLVEVE